MFFFVVDETPAAQLPSLLLDDLIGQRGPIPLAVVAYAVKSKEAEGAPPPTRVRDRYTEARLNEDIRQTPAA